jgi:type VI secretion system secreted protein VgrG
MNLEQYRYPHLYQLQQDGKRYVDIELLRNFSMSAWVDVTTDVSRMTPGYVFELFGHRRPDYNVPWWVVRVEHRGEQPQVLEHEAPDRGMMYGASVRAIRNTTRFIPASDHPRNRIYGMQTAIVTGPNGEEIFPDQYGRVKVQFHWDREGKRDENTSCWIRVSRDGLGTVRQPVRPQGRPGGDRVLPGRRSGQAHHHRPGFQLSQSAPQGLPANKTRTAFKSNSTPSVPGQQKYSEVRIEDKAGSEEIYVRSEKDVNIYVKNDYAECIDSTKHLIVGGDKFDLVNGETNETYKKDRMTLIEANEHKTVKETSHNSIGGMYLLESKGTSHINSKKIFLTASEANILQVGSSSIIIKPDKIVQESGDIHLNCGMGTQGQGQVRHQVVRKPQRRHQVAKQKYYSARSQSASNTSIAHNFKFIASEHEKIPIQ